MEVESSLRESCGQLNRGFAKRVDFSPTRGRQAVPAQEDRTIADITPPEKAMNDSVPLPCDSDGFTIVID